jgi:cytosine deaminase
MGWSTIFIFIAGFLLVSLPGLYSNRFVSDNSPGESTFRRTSNNMPHATFLDIACSEAAEGKASGEYPAGAVLVKDGSVVARGHDRCRALNDPVATPEMECIRRAGRRADQRQLTLYCTRYPDMLAAGTIIQFSIGRVVVGLPEAVTPALSLLGEKSVPLEFASHAGCRALAEGDR